MRRTDRVRAWALLRGQAAGSPPGPKAERTGSQAEYAVAVDELRRRGGGHDPGTVPVDLTAMLADGRAAIADIAALAD